MGSLSMVAAMTAPGCIRWRGLLLVRGVNSADATTLVVSGHVLGFMASSTYGLLDVLMRMMRWGIRPMHPMRPYDWSSFEVSPVMGPLRLTLQCHLRSH